MNLQENQLSQQTKQKKNHSQLRPENMYKSSKRWKVYKYLKKHPGACSNELKNQTGVPKSSLLVMSRRGLLNRVLDRSIARYRYWIKKEFMEAEK